MHTRTQMRARLFTREEEEREKKPQGGVPREIPGHNGAGQRDATRRHLCARRRNCDVVRVLIHLRPGVCVYQRFRRRDQPLEFALTFFRGELRR